MPILSSKTPLSLKTGIFDDLYLWCFSILSILLKGINLPKSVLVARYHNIAFLVLQ
ncbi:MAG: hypothetical protein ACI9JT_002079, partial [Polaribacter sp.]